MDSQADLKPIKVWGRGGPNPPKVTMILEELGLPYEHMPIAFSDVKKPEYLAINPNGRLPAIHDPNYRDTTTTKTTSTDADSEPAAGLTLWESGAIVDYLVERYDRGRRLSFPAGSAEAHHARQWLFFQATGQGPYFGQATWFKVYHGEVVPSALRRYVAEVNRVSGVLESYLGSQDKEKKEKEENGGDGPWLVGGKLTYADISFIPWFCWMEWFLDEDEFKLDNYPVVKGWLDRMRARESVAKVLRDIKPANARNNKSFA